MPDLDYIKSELKKEFNNRINFKEKRPGIQQLFIPVYHEDGDMIEIYLQFPGNRSGAIRICDFGMTLMRLSYHFNVDTPNKEKILYRILAENGIQEEKGNLFIDTDISSLYPALLQFAQTVAKVCNMRFLKREIIAGLFYENLSEFVKQKMNEYSPSEGYLPISDRDELEVDYCLTGNGKDMFLFGVKDVSKARLVAISCLEFQKNNIQFRSLAVHEDFDSLPRKDRARITSACDKQFPSLDDFRRNALSFLQREKA